MVPLLFIGFVLVVLFVCFAAFYLIKKEVEVNEVILEKRGVNIVIFVLCLISLVISLGIFWNISEYADVHGSSPVLITGGSFWNGMDWFRLGILFVLCLISGFKLIKRSK